MFYASVIAEACIFTECLEGSGSGPKDKDHRFTYLGLPVCLLIIYNTKKITISFFPINHSFVGFL